MKKLISFLPVLLILFVSCSHSPEKKAEALIKEAVLKTLYLPDTYQAVETVLDSAFSPYQEPKFIASVLDLYETALPLEDLEREISHAQSSMSIWDQPYASSFARNEYQEAKKKYEEAVKQQTEISEKVKAGYKELATMAEVDPEFIGYVARHRFRANNNEGATLLADYYFFLDKSLTEIVAAWDEEQISIYNEFFNQLGASE